MNSELNRIHTFYDWPASTPVNAQRIAKAGFFYTGVGLEVQCFRCNCKISNWNYGDQVMCRHRQLKPNCPFVLNPTNSGNIPLLDMFACNNAAEPAHRHVEDSVREFDGPYDYGLTEEDEMYRSDALRLLSFINWDDVSVSREALVTAGFYHAGEGRLRCAWCGGELTPYRSFGSLGANPIEIHRMYFPRCEHAVTVEAALNADGNAMSSPPSPPSVTPPIRSPETNEGVLSSGAAHNSRILSAGNTWRALGVVGSGPRHTNQASLSNRLASFHGWPEDKTQSPRMLAEAGFFHTGIDDQGSLSNRLATFHSWPEDKTQSPRLLAEAGRIQLRDTGIDDQVRCFYCDGGLGRWEAGDAPWTEHARWFPACGYVLLVRGADFVEQCRVRAAPAVAPTANNSGGNRRNLPTTHPVTDAQIDECMESGIALGALGAGLDAARVRRAIQRRLRSAGVPFTSSEALIDAVLDDQLGEEAWSVSSQSQRFAQNILADTLRELGVPQRQTNDSSTTSESDRTRTPSPNPPVLINRVPRINLNQNRASNRTQPSNQTQPSSQTQPADQTQPSNQTQPADQTQRTRGAQPIDPILPASQLLDMPNEVRSERDSESENCSGNRSMSLEEENRQLKEARLCKVCMDSEVSVVFLPCGHLVSCGRCGSALAACPLCRSAVRALVRAYLS